MLVGDVMIVGESEVLLLLVLPLWVECDAPIDQFVFAALVALEGLAPDLLLTIDQAILVSMVIEVNLPHTPVDLDDFLPVVRSWGALIMFNKFELVGESPSKNEVILTVLIVASYFLNNQPFIVLKYSDTSDNTIYLSALSVEVYLAFLIEDCFLPIRA